MKFKTSASFLRDIVFGAYDGVVTTIGFLVGFAGSIAEQKVIVLAGFLGIIAGAVSMALGNYLAVKSQEEFYEKKEETERDSSKVSNESPILAGIFTALFYLLGGIPLVLPFLFLTPLTRALLASILVSVFIMGFIGVLRWVFDRGSFSKRIAETVVIGLLAAAIGFLAAEALQFFGI